MGARPDQDFAINYLDALAQLWMQRPGMHEVRSEDSDLAPAIAQICIKWLAAEVRESEHLPALQIRGKTSGSGGDSAPDMGRNNAIHIRSALNKLVHGSPHRVFVADDDIYLCYVNSDYGPEADEWSFAWFSALDFIKKIRQAIYSHQDRLYQVEEIKSQLEEMASQRLLPPPSR